jgi:hypothetical protein
MNTMVIALIAGVLLVLYLARRRHRLNREVEAD